jgi:cytidine deaminase
MADRDPEDEKLITLARSALARNGNAKSAAAVRDDIGRTYVAAAVSVGDLQLSAVRAAVVLAVSSGVARLEAVAVVSPDAEPPDSADVALLDHLGGDVAVHVANAG